MKTATTQLLQELQAQVKEHLEHALLLQAQPLEALNHRTGPKRWSALECLEHLNRYGHFYLPEIETQIDRSHTQPEAEFKSGWLGNYFAESMRPKRQLNAMKTFRKMDPIHSQLDKAVVATFIQQQQKLLQLLEKASHISLTKTKTGISISRFIRLRLGDTFRFVIYHNERHLLQAQRALEGTDKPE